MSDETIVGRVGFKEKPLSEPGTAHLYIPEAQHNIEVDELLRGQKHGIRLIHHALNEARKLGYKRFRIENPYPKVRQFYLKSFDHFMKLGLISEVIPDSQNNYHLKPAITVVLTHPMSQR